MIAEIIKNILLFLWLIGYITLFFLYFRKKAFASLSIPLIIVNIFSMLIWPVWFILGNFDGSNYRELGEDDSDLPIETEPKTTTESYLENFEILVFRVVDEKNENSFHYQVFSEERYLEELNKMWEDLPEEVTNNKELPTEVLS